MVYPRLPQSNVPKRRPTMGKPGYFNDDEDEDEKKKPPENPPDNDSDEQEE